MKIATKYHNTRNNPTLELQPIIPTWQPRGPRWKWQQNH